MSLVLSILNDKGKAMLAFIVASLASLYILSAGGCDFGQSEVVKETNEPLFLRGQEEMRRGNINSALNSFLKVTDKRKDAPESHFELGRIYLDNMNDPISAIYHFRKYLELNPDSSSKVTPVVRQMIETAQKKFVAAMPETPYENNNRRMELEDILKKYQKENDALKQKLDTAIRTIDSLKSSQRIVVSSSPTSSSASNATPSASVSTASNTATMYTVLPGDTLSNISYKVYGTRNRWREIFAANRDRMAAPESLKPGQVLRIPR